MTNKTVIVGISGGVRSTVAAYILKRQKYNVVGVSILFSDAQNALLNHNREKLESFFQKHQIPYYQIQEYKRYSSLVVDFINSSRISGHLFCAETAHDKLLIDALVSQMARFKADKVATGHSARVVLNHQTDGPEIYRLKNIAKDQSHLLTFLTPKQLSCLELPLTGMQSDDIEKVANILKITPFPQKSFLQDTYQNLSSLMEKKIPLAFRQEGEIFHYLDQRPIGTHKGVHHFSLGSPLPSPVISLNDDSLKKKNMIPVQIVWQLNRVVVMEQDKWIPCTHIVLSDCQYFSHFQHKFPAPSNLTIRINSTTLIPVQIRHLNNHNVLCVLKKPYPSPLFPQVSAIIYDGEKVAMGGKIFQVGHMRGTPEIQLQLLPPSREEESNDAEYDRSNPLSNDSLFKF